MLDSQEMIENLFSLSREEVNSVTFKKSSTNKSFYWDIKIYGLATEYLLVAKKAFEINEKLSMRAPTAETNLTPFDKMKDNLISVELSKTAKGEYSWEIKTYFKNGEDASALEKVKACNEYLEMMAK